MSCVASEGRRWRIASQLTRFDSKGDGGAWGDGGERKASRSGGVERLSVVSVILPSHENERHLGRALGARLGFTAVSLSHIVTSAVLLLLGYQEGVTERPVSSRLVSPRS